VRGRGNTPLSDRVQFHQKNQTKKLLRYRNGAKRLRLPEWVKDRRLRRLARAFGPRWARELSVTSFFRASRCDSGKNDRRSIRWSYGVPYPASRSRGRSIGGTGGGDVLTCARIAEISTFLHAFLPFAATMASRHETTADL
jgi:hypothetical protein